MNDPLAAFTEALRKRGIVVPKQILADGKLHRCDVEGGKSGKGDASYILHLDGIAAGGCRNWKDGRDWENWSAKPETAMTEYERRKFISEIERQRRLRNEEEKQRRTEAVERAKSILKAATPAGNDHEYLQRKGVLAHGIALHRAGSLVVPIRNVAGDLQSLQFIALDGGKRFLSGGAIAGGFHLLGTVADTLVVAEGYATAATVHEVTNLPVAVAFDAGNLEAVAKAWREAKPGVRIVIAADDDHRTEGNPGLTKARKAAESVGGMVVTPDFGPNRPEKATDWNDLAAMSGMDAVKRQFAALNRVEDTQTKPDRAGRLHLVHFDEITPRTTSNALIKGLLGAGQLSVLYGASNVGKTFLALYLAMLVALGREWRDRQVRQGGVVYVAAEGGFGISNRVAAFRQHHGISGTAPFAIVPCSVDMCGPEADTAELIALVLAAIERMGMPVSLIVVDTLSRALSGGNENDSADMGAFVKHADKLRLETGAHVMVIHHSGKDEARGARGHSLLRAAVDTELEVTRDAATKIAVMRPVKQRELPTDGEFVFTLDVVELGEDEDGDPVTSCVVKPSDAPATKTAKLSPSNRVAMDALHKAILDLGTTPPASTNIPRHTKAVHEHQWRDYAYKCAVSGSEKQDSKQRAFKRAADELRKSGMIGVWDGWVWLAKTPSPDTPDKPRHSQTSPVLSGRNAGGNPDRHGQHSKSCPMSGSPASQTALDDDLATLAEEGLS